MSDSLEGWSLRSSGVTNSLLGSTYGNGTFVTVGEGGLILTSSDGVDWTQRESGITESLRCVTFGDHGFVVAGGEYSVNGTNINHILTSPDGVQWTSRYRGENASDSYSHVLAGICFGGGQYVAAGGDNLIMTSPDGITWSNHLVAGFGFDRRPLYAATYGAGIYWAVGYQGRFSSTNGITWTGGFGNGILEFAITYASGKFVTTPSNVFSQNPSEGAIHVWYDGGQTTSGPYKTMLLGVAYGDGIFTVVGTKGTILTSPFEMPIEPWTSRGSTNLTREDLHSVTYGNGFFVAVGRNGTIVQSADLRPRLMMKGPVTAPSEGVQVEITAPIGSRYMVERSTDHLEWSSLLNATNVTEKAYILDSETTTNSHRLYRTKSYPQ